MVILPKAAIDQVWIERVWNMGIATDESIFDIGIPG